MSAIAIAPDGAPPAGASAPWPSPPSLPPPPSQSGVPTATSAPARRRSRTSSAPIASHAARSAFDVRASRPPQRARRSRLLASSCNGRRRRAARVSLRHDLIATARECGSIDRSIDRSPPSLASYSLVRREATRLRRATTIVASEPRRRARGGGTRGLYCTVLYCTVLNAWTVLYCTVLYCIVKLCCTVQYVLYCTVL